MTTFLDTETRSRTPIEHGTDKYTRDAECTIVTWAKDREPVQLWDRLSDPIMPQALEEILLDDSEPLVAHSAKFDFNIVLRSLKIRTRFSRWICTQAQAYSHGLPGSLEMLGVVLGLPLDQQKLVDDAKLIHVFCEPDRGGAWVEPWMQPEAWARFCNYAVRDTESLREIFLRLPSHNFRDLNLDAFHLDFMINERGFGFDEDFARAVVPFLKSAKAKTDAGLAKATGNIVTAGTQRERLLRFLQEKYKLDITNMRASEIRDWLEMDDLNPEVRYLLETRLESAKSSGSKYATGLRKVGPRNRMRHTLQFNGAGRTGRWSGRGYQPQNMQRPMINVRKLNGKQELAPVKADYIDEVIMPGIYSGAALRSDIVYGGPNEAAAISLRHAIVAALGNELVVADWSNIESRVLAWIAGQDWKLKAYILGDDLYKLLASSSLGIGIGDVNDTQRQAFKVVELACGFGGGVGALVTMAATYQMDLEAIAAVVLPLASPAHLKKARKAWRRAFITGEDYALEPHVYMACDVLKQTYRESNNSINQFRYDLDGAIKAAIREPGRGFLIGKCKIFCNGTALIIELPSGRRLIYMSPRIHETTEMDADTGKEVRRQSVSYMTARGKSWRREKAWAGLFVENIVQAIANDVLRWALVRVHQDTLTVPEIREYLETLPEEERTAICLDVHDEIVLDVPKGSYSLKRFLEQLVEPFEWSHGLPLAAEGWQNFRYGKREGQLKI